MNGKHARDHPFKWSDLAFYGFMIITWSAIGLVMIVAILEIIHAYMATI